MTRVCLTLAWAGLAGLSVACGSGSSGGQTGQSQVQDLTGTEWRLVSLAEVGAIDPARAPTLGFQELDRVGGNTGCNQYGGPVSLEGTRIRFGPLVATKMACVDTLVQQIETAYLAALEATTTFRIDGEQLVLEGEGGTELARLTRA